MVWTQIKGVGSAFPSRSFHNSEFEGFLDTTDEWIQTRTGIQSRRIANLKKGESTLSLALDAASKALGRSGVDPKDLGAVIVGTVTPMTVMPCTANQLQAALGAKNAFSFDLQAACSGFLYGMSVVDQFVRQGQIRHGLVVGVETLSTITNWRDRGTAVLFGDGAGAVVFSAEQDTNRGIIATKLYSDGEQGCHLSIPHGYAAVPTDSAEYRENLHKITMNGQEIFKLAVRAMISSSETILKEQGFKVSDIDYFLFHQANMRILEMITKQLGIPKEKMWVNLDKYGNTSAATLPVCLDEAMQAGVVKTGDLVLMSTFGGGATWGSALVRL